MEDLRLCQDREKTFEGCSFINVLLESDIESPMRGAAAIHLAKIRAIIHGLAKEAHLRDPARNAKRAARLILDGWVRKS
jgi:hypothetical protein